MAPDDQQTLLEAEAPKPKRSYVHRRRSTGGSSLDSAFDKNIRTSRGSFVGIRSAADLLLQQQCERALNGSAQALRDVFKHHEENQKALEAGQIRFAAPGPRTPEVRKLIEAALILDIFTLDVGIEDRSWYQQGGYICWTEWKMLLSDWAAAVGVRRWEEILE